MLTAVVFALGHLPLALFGDVTALSFAVSFLLYVVVQILSESFTPARLSSEVPRAP